MKLAKPISLSMAINCLAFITPLLVGAQSLKAQAADNSAASSTTDPSQHSRKFRRWFLRTPIL